MVPINLASSQKGKIEGKRIEMIKGSTTRKACKKNKKIGKILEKEPWLELEHG